MTLKSSLRLLVIVSLLSHTTYSFAAMRVNVPKPETRPGLVDPKSHPSLSQIKPDPNQKPASDIVISDDTIYDPSILSLDSMLLYEKAFNFDWNNYVTIAPNQKKLEEITTFIKNTKSEDIAKLKDNEKEAYGKILFKAGTFYAHVFRQPDLAIERLKLAAQFLKTKEDKAWSYNHLAYAYEQKFASSRSNEFREEGFNYINKVIALLKNARNKEVAFAYCIKGSIENDGKNYGYAESNFKEALTIYEKIPGAKDDQYARARNRLAINLLAMDDRDNEAIKIFQEVKKYWQAKGHLEQNPFAAKNLICLGQAYLKIQKPKEAREELEKGITIYQNIYGRKSTMLIEPYQLIADSYKDLGDKKLADSYEQQATALERG